MSECRYFESAAIDGPISDEGLRSAWGIGWGVNLNAVIDLTKKDSVQLLEELPDKSTNLSL